ncbi:ComEC/Rec2 family competence protein [Sulfitobacter aestuarii]|uniref:ComEC/Rec2 family competence protein n=1 Tax=Sulfitobacter aestuarii TaxID=2161676 RepID=A0ABW5TYW4_9RHOB
MGLRVLLSETMRRQRGHLIGWVPVCLAAGVGLFFSLKFEPQMPLLSGLALVMFLLILLVRHLPETISPLCTALILCLLGFLLAAARTHMVQAPMLSWRYYGPVEGRVVAIDRSGSDALRLTLDQVRLDRISPARLPHRVRLSLHGDLQAGITPEPGLRVMTTAHLSPPGGPVEPDGFDFQRHAFFAGLGAVGYTRVPLLGVAPASEGQAGLAIARLRMAVSARIRAVLPGDIGGFATAITTGDRSAISGDALQDLRTANLAHLLAISGLHMGLLSALVFGALRLLLALHPVTALYWPTRQIAAAGALLAALGYLALSGGNVATQRAFIMVAVALGALMIGRRALSIRAVAVAASIVLLLRPEALMGPGFQMSFAATTALVAVFGWLRDVDLDWMPNWLRPAVAVFISSGVAGAATAPIAAAHFNMIAHYGLIANLLCVPLMGTVVIPAALAAALLAPFGFEALPLWLMGKGLAWILGVAQAIAEMEGARGAVPSPGRWVVPLLALGCLMLILWQGWLRWSGVLVVMLAFLLWSFAERPALLIAETGTLVGAMTAQGRALSKERSAGFVARNWLENDGDPASQADAAARWPRGAPMRLGRIPVLHLTGKRAASAFVGCRHGQIVVSSVKLPADIAASCEVFDPARLKETGAVALYREGEKLRLVTARDRAGARLWNHWERGRE